MKVTHEIDDLLKVVSPELVAGYEAKNLDGKTLRDVCEEYKVVSTKREKLSPNLFWFITIVLMMVCPATAVGVWCLTSSFGFMVVLTVVELIPFFIFLDKFMNKTWEYNQTIAQCEEVLDGFRQAVKAVDSIKLMANSYREYSEGLIHQTLAALAFHLVASEKDTVQARKDKGVTTEVLLQRCLSEVECRAKFNEALLATENFGLSYKATDLFREASRFVP